MAAFGVATPLVRDSLLAFLDGGNLAAGVDGIASRLGWLVAGAMALHTYSDLVRSPERAVLDPHPVKAAALLSAVAEGTARARLYLPIGCALLLLPIAVDGHVVAWLGAVGVVFGAWLCSLGVGFTVHLAAVWAAYSPGLARVLDAIRGDNPRLQAALIYAPGAVLGVVGLAVALASAGLQLALGGWTPGWVLLALPPLLGAVGWAMAAPLGRAWYVRATALLAEIDGLYAVADGETAAEEARHVYLDWLARGRPEMLRTLRAGWRAHRGWAMGAWGLGLVGLSAAWNADPVALDRTLVVSGAAVALMGALPGRLSSGDPAWLDQALGVEPFAVFRARAAATFLYAQGAILPPSLALVVRHGLAALPVFLALQLVAAAAGGAGALTAWRWRARAPYVYGSVALVGWAVLVWSSRSGEFL